MYYRIIFTNCEPKVVYASTRANAITQAVRLTRGYISATDQRQNVLSCKIYND